APLAFALQAFDHAELALLGDLDVDLRGGDVAGEGAEHLFGGAFVEAEDFQQAGGAVDAVIEAEPALLEEDVAAHLAGQQCAGFLHLLLDQRVPGLPHHRPAAVAADQRGQAAGALDVEDDVGAGVARYHVLGEQHQQAVGVDDGAGVGHHADAVAVAVEGQAEVGVFRFHPGDQVDQIFRLARVRVVVGEGAIHFAEQRDDAAAQGLDQLRGDDAGGAVAAIDHHAQRLGQGDVVADVGEVALQNIDLLHAADAAGQVVVVQAGLEREDLFIGQGVAGDDDLETVVIRWIVAAGEHHRRAALKYVGGEIHHGGRHHADVGHLAAAIEQALHQLLQQFGAGEAPVAADDDVGFALCQALRADGAADPVGVLGGQRVAHHATYVVGAEDVGGKGRNALASGHGKILLQSQEILVFIENVDIEDIGVLKQRVDQLGGFGRRLSDGRWRWVAGHAAGAIVVAAGEAGQVLGQ